MQNQLPGKAQHVFQHNNIPRDILKIECCCFALSLLHLRERGSKLLRSITTISSYAPCSSTSFAILLFIIGVFVKETVFSLQRLQNLNLCIGLDSYLLPL